MAKTKITIVSLCTLLALAACHKQQAVVTAFPCKMASDNKWGIIASDGKLVAVNAYEHQPSMATEELFWIQEPDNYYRLYHCNRPNKPVTTKKYHQAGNFFEKVTWAQEKPGSPLMLINKRGKTISHVDYYGDHPVAMAHNFKDGMALICTANLKYGYVNTKGRLVVNPAYDMAYDFSDGLALVGLCNAEGQVAWKVINKEGATEFQVSLADCRISESYSCGLLTYRNMKEGYCAAMNKKGKTVFRLPGNIVDVLPYKYDAAICVAVNGVGLANKAGEITIQPNYENGKVVGPDRVALQWKKKWALFDFNGKALSEFVYDEVFEFHHPDYTFVRLDGTYRLINKQGKTVNNNHYELVYTDPIIKRNMPQVFLRNEKTAATRVATNTQAATSAEAANKNTAQPMQAGEQPKAETTRPTPPRQTGNYTQIELVREVSKESPFYEESRKIIAAGLSEDDARNRQMILNYVEHFRTAYTTKDIDFLRQLFSEEALIIVGKVVKETARHPLHLMSRPQIEYNIRSKKSYLTRLQAVFDANREIEVSFEDFNIMRHPTREGFYGVSLKQGYRSDLYSDEGHLFLLWDFRDKQAPLIHVRTWQPSMLSDGVPLPAEDIFNLGNFNLQ